ncbi:hypothetical protein CJF30_00000052 [Rutstroemia sp. NJR-2017a BBW]|nr:hypothetical protein CJF30_00000052 [Rutstroemia sp. NJR-2017a BBW]
MSWETTGAGDWGTGAAVASADDGGGGGGWDAPAAPAAEGGGEWGGGITGEETSVNGHDGGECLEPPTSRPCFNCGEEGHMKSECTNPPVAREFTGTCRLCEQQGHRAAECPTAPPKLCNNCKEEGHSILECKNPRKIERNDIEDVAAEVAWDNLIKASKDDESDFDDLKDELMKYIKASPDATYVQLESAFRAQNIPIYLIAIEKELAPTFTNMDLQGNLDRKYTVSFRKSPKHSRPKEKDAWPATPEENLERLANAGEAVDRGVPLCSRCGELGHTSKRCSEEANESERVVVQCYNCNEIGHRVRDCPTPRVDKFACRNCKKSGHSSKECPEPRSAEGVECKNCNEIGHFSRDCPQGGGGGDGGLCRNCNQPGHRAKDCTNERVIICRNCDEEGHTGKECPKPRDYSRVQCQNCKQMGHTKVRCKEPIVEEDGDNGYGGDATGAVAEPHYGDDENADAGAAGGEDGWGAAATTNGGGW